MCRVGAGRWYIGRRWTVKFDLATFVTRVQCFVNVRIARCRWFESVLRFPRCVRGVPYLGCEAGPPYPEMSRASLAVLHAGCIRYAPGVLDGCGTLMPGMLAARE